MKYLVTFKAKRKNAKRHVDTLCGRARYFNTLSEAEKANKRHSTKWVSFFYT